MHIQIDNYKKRGVLTDSHLHQLIKHSQTFLSKVPPCNCFAPLPQEATNFENGYHIKKCYSVLHSTNDRNIKTRNLHFAQNYTWNLIGVLIFVGRSGSKSHLQHNVCVCPSLLTDMQSWLCNCRQYLALTVSGIFVGGCVYSRLQHSRCTAVNGSDFTKYTTDRLFYLW